MEIHRIALISDTHGILRPEVTERLKDCEAILHCGDIDRQEILSMLKEFCPVYAVRGNADKAWAQGLPEELEIRMQGFRIYMIHNRKQVQKNLSQFDIVAYGHSHKYEERMVGRTWYLNPGSCGQRRFRLPLTMMLLNLLPEEHRIETERIEISAQSALVPSEESRTLSDKDMYQLIKTVIKEIEAGKTVADIASRKYADEEMVEQICRMYVTHPGVDADGIMDRIERKNL